MRKIIILTLLALWTFSCQKETDCNYIDNYYQTVYLAEEAYHKKDFERVVALMAKAEANCELLNQPIIYETLKYAESAARLGKNKKAFELIRNLILKGDKITYLKDIDAFQNIVNTNQWLELEKDYDSLRNEYLSSINLELREKIREMSRLDQIYNNPKIDGIKLSDSMDAINEKELKQIIAEFGYPNESLIGDFKIDFTPVGIGTMLFHFDDYDYWTTTLKEFIKKGKAPPISLGNYVDSYQRRVPQKEKYIYGIYNNASEKNIIEYDKLDERRIAIGLPSMKLKKTLDSLRNIQ
ncbi:hypothetical protein [Winogradskyella sp.]|uniref:hypothetical protein n=1 Tax=Winogradskyella sp. TaxID=1883156 RepID=UPI0026114535|nr:hypothetical protein [Winogradskyella sp.]